MSLSFKISKIFFLFIIEYIGDFFLTKLSIFFDLKSNNLTGEILKPNFFVII